MSQPSRNGQGARGRASWERRAAGLAGDVQRWLIKTSARNMRDEFSGQVKKAFGGQRGNPADVWATATTERARSATEAPECAWCPVCRAARRVAEARATGGEHGAAAALGEVSEVLTGAVRDVLAGLDSVLSYRPGDLSEPRSSHDDLDRGGSGSDEDHAEELADEPGHRG